MRSDSNFPIQILELISLMLTFSAGVVRGTVPGVADDLRHLSEVLAVHGRLVRKRDFAGSAVVRRRQQPQRRVRQWQRRRRQRVRRTTAAADTPRQGNGAGSAGVAAAQGDDGDGSSCNDDRGDSRPIRWGGRAPSPDTCGATFGSNRNSPWGACSCACAAAQHPRNVAPNRRILQDRRWASLVRGSGRGRRGGGDPVSELVAWTSGGDVQRLLTRMGGVWGAAATEECAGIGGIGRRTDGELGTQLGKESGFVGNAPPPTAHTPAPTPTQLPFCAQARGRMRARECVCESTSGDELEGDAREGPDVCLWAEIVAEDDLRKKGTPPRGAWDPFTKSAWHRIPVHLRNPNAGCPRMEVLAPAHEPDPAL
eukprot:gene16071-biopygen12284